MNGPNSWIHIAQTVARCALTSTIMGGKCIYVFSLPIVVAVILHCLYVQCSVYALFNKRVIYLPQFPLAEEGGGREFIFRKFVQLWCAH